jgi:hypothetical protein
MIRADRAPEEVETPRNDRASLDGGRRAVVEDSAWRTMMALSHFHSGREPDPVFAAWLGRTRPLTRLAALRTILGMDRPEGSRPAEGVC